MNEGNDAEGGGNNNDEEQILVEGGGAEGGGNNNDVHFMSSSYHETGSVQSGMTAESEEETHGFSPVGNIRMKQLTKELRQEERAIMKRHVSERKLERC
mmetsp:Transcript_5790/g.6671  ORF Transcript_5790/g.6671 Transcript_5790/m.6671 type:complete len:99 (-) Transcript_5790:2339-2635(-)